MATRDEIYQVRIAINDPADILQILTVPDQPSLPGTPAPQTAYYDEANLVYWIADEGSNPVTYSFADLLLSDSVIEQLIDSVGVDNAVCRAFYLLTRRLGAKMGVKRSQVGTDSTEYQSLKEMYDYYKDMADVCKEQNRSDNNNSTGRYATIKQPKIGGGNL